MPKRLIFTLILVFIIFAILEGASRFIARTRFVQRAPSYQSTMMNDSILHHIWVPSLKKIDNSRSIPYTLITNKQSWVEKQDVSKFKPNNTFRIFYVGDSTTQGVVDSKYKMVEIVERELNRIYAGQDINFEVINTGTSSYSFLLYYLLIKTKLLNYSPDLIVINIDMTDVVNDAAYRRLMVVDDAGEAIAVPAETSQRYILTPQGYSKVDLHFALPPVLVRHSDFFYLIDLCIRKIYLKRTKLAENKEANWLDTTWSPTIVDNVNKSLKVLASTVKLLRSYHVPVAVTGVPHFPQYIGMWSVKPHEILGEFSQKAGVAYLNSYLALKDKISGSKLSDYYWDSDGTHFNREGNRIWAQAQLKFLLDPKNQLIPFTVYKKSEVIENLKHSSEFWKNIPNRQTKKRAVIYFINQYKEQGVNIKKPVSRYIFLMDSLSSQKPELLSAPFGKLLIALARAENDYSKN